MAKLGTRIAETWPLRLARKTAVSLAQDGLMPTFAKIRRFVRGESNVESYDYSDKEQGYEFHRDAQETYIRAYATLGFKGRRRALEDFLEVEHGYRGIVIYPAAYDLTLRQRPEHVLRTLANDGYLCLILTIGGDQPIIRRRGSGIYECNLYEDVLTYFRTRPVVLYITAPMHRYVAGLMPLAFVVYDVVDKLEIFANFCDAMVSDHDALLKRADLVMCSSEPLYARNAPRTGDAHLVPNGVFPEDFLAVGNPAVDGPLVVGYHGAITELLDFDLLDRLAGLPAVELLVAGPITAFAPKNLEEVVARTSVLFARPNVTHLGLLGYEELKPYLARIHCGLVPFRINASTDEVSPLKFFEFVAAGKPVLSTSTRTMRQYCDIALVGEANEIVDAVAQGTWNRMVPSRHAALTHRHAWTELTAPLRKALERLDLRNPASPVPMNQSRVDIVNFNFFDWHGANVYKGGAERYVLDLAHVCRELGLRVRIVQNAYIPFQRNFHGIDVEGVPIADKLDLRAISRGFRKVTQGADLVIASPLDLASELDPQERIVGINHGIHWDARSNRLEKFNIANHQAIFDALRNTDTCVCVDTNFINWVRTIDWPLAQRLEYVPNYVNANHFAPVDKDFSSQRVVALFPRRLYDARGFNETLEAFDFLIPRHPHLDLHLCGQASSEDAERTRRFISRHPGRVLWYELPMEEMSSAYRQSHIVLIPTAYAEGTSLSCIEAMATNNGVIATNVGGLPNLIVDGYSGLLIRPDTWDLVHAIQALLDDRQQLAMLARNALIVSSVFSMPRWQRRWETLIRAVMHLPAPTDARTEQPARHYRAA